jgi:FG-GAP-like repeat/Putative metal-binding motif
MNILKQLLIGLVVFTFAFISVGCSFSVGDDDDDNVAAVDDDNDVTVTDDDDDTLPTDDDDDTTSTDDDDDIPTDTDCRDLDGDGYGQGSDCLGADCDDENADINPDVTEVTGNDVDEDCSGVANDVDGDGEDSVANGGTDCDDHNPSVNPAAADSVGDGIDNNCDGIDGVDEDGDGFSSELSGGTDCDDGAWATNPDATEIDNLVDDDCDGDAVEAATFDLDGDGYTAGFGTDTDPTPDCDDGDPNNWTDVGCASCVDVDGDGYRTGCDAYLTIDGPDCDDLDAAVELGCGSCIDYDGDGYGPNCSAGLDCFDFDPTIHDCSGDETFDAPLSYIVYRGFDDFERGDISMADLDLDGDLDLVAGGETCFSGEGEVWLNNGDGTFASPMGYYFGFDKLTTVDIDGDGYLDILSKVDVFSSGYITNNNGDGTFGPTEHIVVTDIPENCGLSFISIAGNYYGDARAEIAASFYGDGCAADQSFLEYDGMGYFTTSTRTIDLKSTPGDSLPQAADDIDGDGDVDIIELDSLRISVYLNNGGGIFTDAIHSDVSVSPIGFELGDLDGDGDLDMAQSHSQVIYVLQNDGMGSFSESGQYSQPGDEYNADVEPAFGDVDGDDDLDIIAELLSNDLNNSLTHRVLINDGSGAFSDGGAYSIASDFLDIEAGDLDGDGRADFAGFKRESRIIVSHNKGDGTFVESGPIYTAGGGSPSGTRAIFAADFDNDADVDVVVAETTNDAISILTNNGDGTFAAAQSYDAGDRPVSTFAADFDGDGDIDLAAANENSDSVTVFDNDGSGGFDTSTEYAIGDSPRCLFAGDFDADGDADLAASNMYSKDFSILLSNGDGTFAPEIRYPLGASSRPRTITAGDIDGDGDLDLTMPLAVTGAPNISHYKNNGDGTFSESSRSTTPGSPWFVAYGDLDNDGDLDMVAATGSAHYFKADPTDRETRIHILFNRGDGVFELGGEYTSIDYAPHAHCWILPYPDPVDVCWRWEVNVKSIAIADLNGDDYPDLVIPTGQSVETMINNGDGTFSAGLPYLPANGVGYNSIGSLFPGDFDRDGRLDLAVMGANKNRSIGILFGGPR